MATLFKITILFVRFLQSLWFGTNFVVFLYWHFLFAYNFFANRWQRWKFLCFTPYRHTTHKLKNICTYICTYIQFGTALIYILWQNFVALNNLVAVDKFTIVTKEVRFENRLPSVRIVMWLETVNCSTTNLL